MNPPIRSCFPSLILLLILIIACKAGELVPLDARPFEPTGWSSSSEARASSSTDGHVQRYEHQQAFIQLLNGPEAAAESFRYVNAIHDCIRS